MVDRTTIIIAYRLPTIRAADKILVELIGHQSLGLIGRNKLCLPMNDEGCRKKSSSVISIGVQSYVGRSWAREVHFYNGLSPTAKTTRACPTDARA